MGIRNSKPSLLPREEINPNEKKFKTSVLIPEEIIEEILSRLPAKSLLRFRCVSKSRRSLIGSKFFIQKHLRNITKIKTYDHWRVIYDCLNVIHEVKHISMQSYYHEPSFDLSPFDDPKNIHLTTASAIVVGHCNGVLCILKQPGCFFLWNPTTRISIELPKLESSVTRKYGFGWDEGSDAFKVFAGVSVRGRIGKVYSTKTNSWKTVDHGCRVLYCGIGKFSSGKIHWLKEGGLHIETFDLNSEEFGMIDQPVCKPKVGLNIWLYENRGLLCVGCEDITNDYKTRKDWSMKEYGVKESWVDVNTPATKYKCCYAAFFYIESLVSPV